MREPESIQNLYFTDSALGIGNTSISYPAQLMNWYAPNKTHKAYIIHHMNFKAAEKIRGLFH